MKLAEMMREIRSRRYASEPRVESLGFEPGEVGARRTFGKARSLIAVTIRCGLYAFRPAPAKLAFGNGAAHSMTSSARARIDGGTERPSVIGGLGFRRR